MKLKAPKFLKMFENFGRIQDSRFPRGLFPECCVRPEFSKIFKKFLKFLIEAKNLGFLSPTPVQALSSDLMMDHCLQHNDALKTRQAPLSPTDTCGSDHRLFTQACCRRERRRLLHPAHQARAHPHSHCHTASALRRQRFVCQRLPYADTLVATQTSAGTG